MFAWKRRTPVGVDLFNRDWLLRGTTVRFNRVHDVIGYPCNDDSAPSVYGIGLDDWTSGVTVFGNLVHDVPRGGIFVNSGHRNVVTNNFVVSNGQGLAVVQRWPKDLELARMGTDGYGLRKNMFTRNIPVGLSANVAVYALEGLFGDTGHAKISDNALDHNVIWTGGGRILVQRLSGQRKALQLGG